MNAVLETAAITEQVVLDILAHGACFVMLTADGMQRLPPDGVLLIPEKLLDARVVIPEAPKVPDRSVPEAIFWRPPDDPPDADTLVLLHTDQSPEPTSIGYWNGQEWWSADDHILWTPGRVLAWADLPAGRVPR